MFLNKSLIFPSNILIIFFLISILLSLNIFNFLSINLEYETYILIILFLVFFILFSNLGSISFSRKNIKKQKINKNYYISVSHSKIMFLIFIQILAVLSLFIELKIIYGSVNSSTLLQYRMAYNFGVGKNFMPYWINLLSNLSTAISVISFYLFISNHFSYNKNNNIKYLLFLSSFLSLPIYILNSSRYDLVEFMIYVFAIYIYYINRNKLNSIKTVIIIFIVSLLGISLFPILGIFLGRSGDLSSSVSYYFGGSIVSLNYVVSHPGFIINPNYFGYETFNTLYKGFSKLNLVNNFITMKYPFLGIYGNKIGNVYSCITAYYDDFGYKGLIIISSIFGYIYGKFYKYISNSPLNGKLNFGVIIYCYFAYTLALSPYSESIANTFLTFGFFVKIFLLYTVKIYYEKM